MALRLLVIRTKDIQKIANFYSLLGFSFDYHQHGNSPFHYSTTIGKTVLEIYPLAKGQIDADKNLRLGFEIDDFEKTIEILKGQNALLLEPTETEFGWMAVVLDSDGRKVEIYKKCENVKM